MPLSTLDSLPEQFALCHCMESSCWSLSQPSQAQPNAPQWRGPNRDGVAAPQNSPRMASQWPKTCLVFFRAGQRLLFALYCGWKTLHARKPKRSLFAICLDSKTENSFGPPTSATAKFAPKTTTLTGVDAREALQRSTTIPCMFAPISELSRA